MVKKRNYDYSAHLVLFVDDEPKIRAHFAKIFGKTFRVILGNDGVAGFEKFCEYEDEIGVIITDQRMPNATGTAFLAKVARRKPGVPLILSTAYADVDAAIAAINEAGVYRYVTKPWDIPGLLSILKEAMEVYINHLGQEKLLQKSVSDKEGTMASESTSTFARMMVQCGEECPRSGIWMVEGTPTTTAKLAKGEIMPAFGDAAGKWKLIAPA